MDIVDPRVDPEKVPAGSKPRILAIGQSEYRDLPSIRTPQHQVITRWRPDAAERRALFNGEDLYLTILAAGPVQPVLLTVGPIDWTPCPLCHAKQNESHDADCPIGKQ